MLENFSPEDIQKAIEVLQALASQKNPQQKQQQVTDTKQERPNLFVERGFGDRT